jgi:hypothetical protein
MDASGTHDTRPLSQPTEPVEAGRSVPLARARLRCILAAKVFAKEETISVCHEVGSQRVASAIGPAWSFSRGCHPSWTSRLVRIRYVSNSLFPNRTGHFRGIRLSRTVTPPVLGSCGLHRTRWGVFTCSCDPSPCPGHYPRRLTTTIALIPYSSRRLGSPIVSRLRCSVFRSPFRWVPRSLRVAGVRCLLAASRGCGEITPHAL